MVEGYSGIYYVATGKVGSGSEIGRRRPLQSEGLETYKKAAKDSLVMKAQLVVHENLPLVLCVPEISQNGVENEDGGGGQSESKSGLQRTRTPRISELTESADKSNLDLASLSFFQECPICLEKKYPLFRHIHNTDFFLKIIAEEGRR
jgi:hypothetical protein